MNSMLKEIETFLSNSNYANSSKNRYKYLLIGFAKYLAYRTESTIEELHLLKIYDVYDMNDKFVAYRPLNTLLVDAFFNSLICKGFYMLRHNREALTAFFYYLNRNYDFPNLMQEIQFNLNLFRPKSNKTAILSNHDILKLIHCIVSESENLERDVLLFSLFFMTGSRLSEITDLKVKNIYWDDNTIFFPKTKHNKSKITPLKSGLAMDIKKYCAFNNLQDENYLFDLSQGQIRGLFYSYLNKAQLPKVKVHSLRHSFATTMIESGASILEVQQLLGHSDVITTKGYVHPNLVRNKNITIQENDEIFHFVKKRLR